MSETAEQYITRMMMGREKASDIVIVAGRIYEVQIRALDTESVKKAVDNLMENSHERSR